MNKKPKVYIASPYTKGDTAKNVKRQMDAFDILVKEGFVPYAPLLSHFQHIYSDISYNKWLELDKEWIDVCDCVLRLRGPSKGADEEVNYALGEADIYVFRGLAALFEYYKGTPLKELNEHNIPRHLL